jgi:predicted esterase
MFSAPASAAQQLDSVLAPGTVVEDVVSPSDSTQRYAVYAPPAYDPDSTWPLLFTMDPRGRALIPLHLIRPAAERFGYVVISSHNTLIDGSVDPNVAALNALLAELGQSSSIDPNRIYLVGFSGTARISWDVAFQLPDRVAGVIGFGAGLPWGIQELRRQLDRHGAPFAFFGGAGLIDFNYWDVSTLDSRLDTMGVRHRIEYYEGPHAWPPTDLFTRSVEWMELQAMHDGVKARDRTWIAELFRRHMDEAQEARDDERLLDALVLYRAIAEDFAGVEDVSSAAAAAQGLAQRPVVREAQQRLDQLSDAYTEYTVWVGRYVDDVRRLEQPPTLEEATERLWIDRLRAHAASGDSVMALAAQRMLETAFVEVAFYGPREYFDRGDPRRALAMLEVAHAIKPTDGATCYRLARAHAELGDPRAAVEALTCTVTALGVDPALLAQDPNLAGIVGTKEFDRWLEERRQE